MNVAVHAHLVTQQECLHCPCLGIVLDEALGIALEEAFVYSLVQVVASSGPC